MEVRTRQIAVVDLDHDIMRRPALFAWVDGEALGWVEPSYLDTWSARPADHYVDGQVTVHEDGRLSVRGEDRTVSIEEPGREDHEDARILDSAIREIEEQRPLAEERERIVKLLSEGYKRDKQLLREAHERIDRER